MSHQTGITANQDLVDFFGTCRDGTIRSMKVIIENEELKLKGYMRAKSSWETDYDSSVLCYLEDKLPCYILYRLDSKNTSGFNWLFISYCPEDSPVRQKMLFASTKSALKKEFGSGQIKEELFGVVPDDVNLRGYHLHQTSVKAPAPLTNAEENLQEIKKTESQVHIGVDTKHQSLGGVAFPITRIAEQKIHDFIIGKEDYIQLSIDIDKEEINYEDVDFQSLNTIAKIIPENHARYHLLRFNHSYESDYFNSIVFIYTMPGYSCSIKERMLYSSCKGPLISNLEIDFKMDIDKKLEVESGEEITHDYLIDAIHPKKIIYQTKFARPKGPTNRGAKRLTKDMVPDSSE